MAEQILYNFRHSKDHDHLELFIQTTFVGTGKKWEPFENDAVHHSVDTLSVSQLWKTYFTVFLERNLDENPCFHIQSDQNRTALYRQLPSICAILVQPLLEYDPKPFLVWIYLGNDHRFHRFFSFTTVVSYVMNLKCLWDKRTNKKTTNQWQELVVKIWRLLNIYNLSYLFRMCNTFFCWIPKCY